MLTVCTFLWGDKYDDSWVNKLAAGLRRNLRQNYRFWCISERGRISGPGIQAMPIEDLELTEIGGCFARLRLFDPEFQQKLKAEDRIACIDLDAIVTGEMDALFDTPAPFMILRGANAANPCPYNGSIWMLRTGHRPDVWSDFSLEAAAKVPFYSFPDDQAWFAHKMPGEYGWEVGSRSGVYAFQKPGWPKDSDDLPKDARLVAFPGYRSPDQFQHLAWVRNHWRQ